MSFKQQDSHKKKRISSPWKKPEGTHSRVRLEKKSAPARPKAGYRTEKDVRGKHPSGYEEVLVHNTSDLEEVDPGEEAARIGSGVGGRKREKIIEKADEEDIKVLNAGDQND